MTSFDPSVLLIILISTESIQKFFYSLSQIIWFYIPLSMNNLLVAVYLLSNLQERDIFLLRPKQKKTDVIALKKKSN